jgi:hypothetical protein
MTSGVVGTALAVDPFGFVLRPGTAYAAVCGPGASCSSGWTAFCATINKGVNACPPGSIAAGWWKMDGASLCGGKARYIIDCNATCSRCSSPGSRAGICSSSCWSCTCTCGPSGSCDRRKVCCNGFRYGQCNTQVRQVGAVQCRVVSCTPPWRFENCSTSPATDNRTRDHNSSELPQQYNAITARYIALGENGSVLGASVYGQVVVPGGRAQRYQKGRISSSATYGTWETYGPVHARYAATGLESGKLGFPRSKLYPAFGGGQAQAFAGGRLTHHINTGAWETLGPVAVRYQQLGNEGGRLAYPLTPTVPVAGGRGVAQQFQKGRISSSPTTGTWEIMSPFLATFMALGREAGPMGFPIAAPAVRPDGLAKAQRFEGGRMSWSQATGVHWVGPKLAAYYRLIGGEMSDLGLPVTNEAPDLMGRPSATYENGVLTYDPSTDTVTRTPVTPPSPPPTPPPTPSPSPPGP